MALQQNPFTRDINGEELRNPHQHTYHVDFNGLFIDGGFLRTLQKAKRSQAVASPLQNQPTELSTTPVEQKNRRKTGHLRKRNVPVQRSMASTR
ncbi:MAG: hypothetical protein R3F04_03250 [Lysobacteraceae bacterium]